MPSTIIPSVIARECIELERLVQTCLERYARRKEFARSGTEDILADSLATCLHSFYTWVERIMEIIVRQIDQATSVGPEWHRELLLAASVEKPGVRPAVLSEESFVYLEKFRAFRHLFRHLYTHRIEPEHIFRLMENLQPAWKAIKSDLESFVYFLEQSNDN